jgi:hypothetical protein
MHSQQVSKEDGEPKYAGQTVVCGKWRVSCCCRSPRPLIRIGDSSVLHTKVGGCIGIGDDSVPHTKMGRKDGRVGQGHLSRPLVSMALREILEPTWMGIIMAVWVMTRRGTMAGGGA